MFILYAVLAGLLIGLLLGGRASGLGDLRFRFAWLAVLGFAAQVVVFSGPVTERIGALGVPLYVGSTGLVFAVLLANVRIPGLVIVAVGAASNLLAIVANGGYMPAAPGALIAAGKVPAAGYSNSAVVADPWLAPLTDMFALPRWLPFNNVFSVGDVLIGLGIALTIVLAMRHSAAAVSPAAPAGEAASVPASKPAAPSA